MRIFTVMGAVYNGWEGVRLQRHQHPREQRLHRRLQCFRQQNGKLPQQHISRDHQPDARGLETCFSAGTLGCNNAAPPIEMPTDPKNTPKCTRARHDVRSMRRGKHLGVYPVEEQGDGRFVPPRVLVRLAPPWARGRLFRRRFLRDIGSSAASHRQRLT